MDELIPKIWAEQAYGQFAKPSLMFSMFPDSRTEEQKQEAARRAEVRKDYYERLNEALLAGDEVARLHTRDEYDECDGCDPGMYAESGASWPCRTAVLVGKQMGVEEPVFDG